MMFKGIKARFGILAVVLVLLFGTFGSIAGVYANENPLPNSGTQDIEQVNDEAEGSNNQSVVSDNQTGNDEDQGQVVDEDHQCHPGSDCRGSRDGRTLATRGRGLCEETD